MATCSTKKVLRVLWLLAAAGRILSTILTDDERVGKCAAANFKAVVASLRPIADIAN
jgi:hypothetical protein